MSKTDNDRALKVLSVAIDVLSEAGETTPCFGLIDFIDDATPAQDLEAICHRCPVFIQCENYAQVAKPLGGVWAGKRWRKTRKRNH